MTRRGNLIALYEAAKGNIDAGRMAVIIGTSLEDGGVMNELTVYQMVVEPEARMLWLWLRIIGGSGWTQIDLDGFPQYFCNETPGIHSDRGFSLHKTGRTVSAVWSRNGLRR